MSYNQATYLPGYSGTTSAAPSAASGPSGTDAILTSEPPSASLSNPKKRKPTKTKPSKQLPRSVSTPQLVGLSAMSDTDDKKRNKLGYQRISIACAVHPGFPHPHFGYGVPDQAQPSWSTPDTFNHEEPMMPASGGSMPKHMWSYGQQGPTGDYAPFPVNVPPVSQSPQAVSPFAFNEPRSDSVWAPQQSPLRSTSYGNVDNIQPNDASFSSAYSAPPPSMRYPPPPLEFSNPTMMLQEPAPFSAPVGPPPHSIPTPHPYAFQQGTPNHNATIPTNQAYPGNWMAMPPRFGPTQEEPGGCGDSWLAEAAVYSDDEAIGWHEDTRIGWF
ncbi:hypothetical protein KC315_g19275 [Hortaea werneckii]|nr:hypothetical protein KC315_g19275 [Hortaea werneckii]